MLAIAAIVVALAAIVLAVTVAVAQRRTRKAYEVFSLGRREDVLTLLQRHIDEVGLVREEVERVDRRADDLRELLRAGISRTATTRYDAFDDMGGQMSFSAALLDERGNGIVLTSINGRTEARSYAKSVKEGDSLNHLSDEERTAIATALGRAPDGEAGTRGRRFGRGRSPARTT